MVVLRSLNEIEGLRRAGDLVARTFEMLRPRVVPGARLDDIDRVVEEFLLDHGAESPYKGYRPSPAVPPFPGTVCASVNEEVVHGIPSRRKLRGGDVVGIDVGALLGGWIGDACYTYPVGEVSPAARKLLDVTVRCLEAGVAEVPPGGRLGDGGAEIQAVAGSHGYRVGGEPGGA